MLDSSQDAVVIVPESYPLPGEIWEVWIDSRGPLLGLILGENTEDKFFTSRFWVLVGDQPHSILVARIFPIGKSTAPFVMPSTRRIYPTLLAHQIVTVQPMTAPTGRFFYLDQERE